ncbi:late blight resistance protein R1-A-like [Salvia hispanica]|uniref:late blight resistance protein R1-A-like n=1 Tax=Salvia hispanica TaxID=49212 RepID=UPI0020097688|nr:late blight resistance protein R1-A-like [Salvia hispanica]
MEGVALGVLLNTLKSVVLVYIQQQKEQSRVIKDATENVDQLENDIWFLTNFEEESMKRRKKENLIMKELLRDVRSSIYDARDAIDSFLAGGVGKPKAKLAEIAQLVESIRKKITPLRHKVEAQYETGGIQNAQDEESAEYMYPPGKPKYVVGFDAKEQQIKDRLTQHTQHIDAIFVTGMHGVGKTTLVAKIFHDPTVRNNFSIPPLWIRVSQPSTKNILLAILKQLDELPEDAAQRCAQDLSKLVAECLERTKFLIVIDDVCEIDNMLMTAFEKSNEDSKILITSNNNETARSVGRDNPSIELQPLKREESWNLLQYMVFGDVGCPPELEKIGNLIAVQCDGLPKTIEIVAGILAKKDSRKFEMNERLKIWKNVSGSMRIYFIKDQGRSNILSSYHNLDSDLRPCLLYMGIFPQRSKFSVSKLIRMWIAEGFVRANESLSLEEIAHTYLKSLIDRNLVIVDDQKPDGSAKICSMNYLMYEFCKTEAGNERENFLEEVKKSKTDGAFLPSIDEVEKYRRVCVHTDLSKFISTFISLRSRSSLRVRLRSFISHSKETCPLKKKDISVIRAAFTLLRVLDAKPMGFTEFPGDLYRLVHLRYVTLSLKGDVLPKDIYKLRSIQTLVVHTTSPSLKIKADILKMTELRHFKTNASATLPKTDTKCNDGEQLQTLCGISPKSCTEIFFDKALNLKKLGIRGQLALLVDGRNELLRKLANVEKLKLLNDVTGSNSKWKLMDVTGSNSKGKLFSLPQRSDQFPPNMVSLTLSATDLAWDQIKILGSLHNLEELKLKDNAFVGDKWEFSGDDKGLPHLQALHIEGLDFVHWQASSVYFPELRKLELSNCTKLMALPLGLADIVNLKKLQLSNTISANASARTIRDAKKGASLDLHIS